MLPCHIIKDLLPSHLDGLTSPETDESIEEHLRGCENCRSVKSAMTGEILLETAPPKEKFVFRKLRRQQIIGAVLTALITLLCIVGLYNLEYNIDFSNTESIEQAINDALPYDYIDADFIEMVTLKDRAFVLYRDGEETEYKGHGVAHFERGIFGKYRLRETADTTWPLLHYFIAEIRGKSYMVISCVNDPVGAETFRIYPNYPDYDWLQFSHSDDPVPVPEGEPFYEGTTEKELLILVPMSDEATEDHYWLYYEQYYDAEGNRLDSAEIVAEYLEFDSLNDFDAGGSLDQDPVQMYVYMIIVLIIGIVFIRYFLVP